MSRGVTTCACGEPAYDGCTQCALCSSDGGLFTPAPAPAPALPDDVPYGGLEERFFKGLNTITRRAVLQALGGHSDALMEEVRNHSDERRLFKHLFKAAAAPPPLDNVKDAAYELAARTVELYDDVTMRHDYMLDATECAEIIRALKSSSIGAARSTPIAQRRQGVGRLSPVIPSAPSTSYAKHGYILQAADGQQTWLKGDPAAGMERYGKIIQLYKKEGT